MGAKCSEGAWSKAMRPLSQMIVFALQAYIPLLRGEIEIIGRGTRVKPPR